MLMSQRDCAVVIASALTIRRKKKTISAIRDDGQVSPFAPGEKTPEECKLPFSLDVQISCAYRAGRYD